MQSHVGTLNSTFVFYLHNMKIC